MSVRIMRPGQKILTIGNPGLQVISPRGGAAAWTPASISGLQLWIDFSDADTLFTDAGSTKVSSDGDAIYQANDKSGNSRHMIQATSDNRPLYKTNVKNSLSTSYFDGTNDYLEGTFTALTTLTLFAVIKVTSNIDDQAMLFFGPKSSGPWANDNAIYTEYKNPNRTDYQLVNAADLRCTNTAVNGSGNFYLASHVIDTSAGYVYINGGSEASDAHTAQSSSCDYHIFGCRYNSAYEKFTQMNLAEVILYNSALSTANRQAVEAYLNNKWNVY